MLQVFQRFEDAIPWTASDTQDLPLGCSYIYIGTGGTLVLDIWNPSQTTTLRSDIHFVNIPAASLWPATRVRKIRANSTCGNMVALIGG